MTPSDECKHGLPPDQCAACKYTEQVWVSAGGQVYHSTWRCSALDAGQTSVERKGGNPSRAWSESLARALSYNRRPCKVCIGDASSKQSPDKQASLRLKKLEPKAIPPERLRYLDNRVRIALAGHDCRSLRAVVSHINSKTYRGERRRTTSEEIRQVINQIEGFEIRGDRICKEGGRR